MRVRCVFSFHEHSRLKQARGGREGVYFPFFSFLDGLEVVMKVSLSLLALALVFALRMVVLGKARHLDMTGRCGKL